MGLILRVWRPQLAIQALLCSGDRPAFMGIWLGSHTEVAITILRCDPDKNLHI